MWSGEVDRRSVERRNFDRHSSVVIGKSDLERFFFFRKG